MKLLKLTDKFESGKHKGKSTSVVINKGESNYLNYFLSRNKDHRLHKDVLELARSKTTLNFNSKLVEVLIQIDSTTSKKLLKLNQRKRMKSIFTNVKAYVTKNDTVIFDTPFGNKRNEIKIGRFVRKVFEMNNVNFTDTEIEQFVSSYASNLIQTGISFKIVSGEDIRKYYLYTNYHSTRGSLGNSCMRHDHCQSRFDLYVFNPNEVSMLVLFDDGSEKIIGRSILWKKTFVRNLETGQEWEGTFMDRIYVNNDRHTELFKKYARDNGFAYKKTQSYSSVQKAVVNGQDWLSSHIKVKLNRTNNVNSPYLDTMKVITDGGYYNGYRY